jgi:hypothetical protein
MHSAKPVWRLGVVHQECLLQSAGGCNARNGIEQLAGTVQGFMQAVGITVDRPDTGALLRQSQRHGAAVAPGPMQPAPVTMATIP